METILRSVGHDVLTYLDGDQLEEKIVRSARTSSCWTS